MQQEIEKKRDAYVDAFRALEKELPGAGTPWLNTLRSRAIASWKALGYPTTKDEKWRYTNVAPIAHHTFAPRHTLDTTGVDADALAPFAYPGLTGASLVFVNGIYAPELSDVSGLPKGVRVESLADVLERDPAVVEPYLSKYAPFEKDAFTALNTALMCGGAFVHVPRGVVLTDPIHLLYASVPGAEGTQPPAAHVRNLVVADESSEVTVIETYAGVAQGVYLTNVVTEVVADANAVVHHYKVQRESESAYHVASLRYHQGRASTVTSHNLAMGGLIVRNDVNAVLGDEGGDLNLNGLYVLREKEHVDNYTVIEHAKPHCTSRELYKGIMDDSSRGIFTGKIHVHPDAQKTDAVQHNPNILLSDGALADSTPQLEIYADDVKCTHGSTIGQLDEEAVFYLRSRGLSEETAKSLLVYAFAREVVDKIRVEAVRVKLEDVLLARLPKGDLVRGAL